ncbi:hypothetical protein OsI_17006 [Oryza sativa Indica Group]|uniref:Uncharacterized protein n=1 Tax=Oryza sativa subsp. indica TaxID=39946 RepID=A2XWH8_ORYSI|nr:hypothetical protein OsI_17006 [Oryza sativa Indica Group]
MDAVAVAMTAAQQWHWACTGRDESHVPLTFTSEERDPTGRSAPQFGTPCGKGNEEKEMTTNRL